MSRDYYKEKLRDALIDSKTFIEGEGFKTLRALYEKGSAILETYVEVMKTGPWARDEILMDGLKVLFKNAKPILTYAMSPRFVQNTEYTISIIDKLCLEFPEIGEYLKTSVEYRCLEKENAFKNERRRLIDLMKSALLTLNDESIINYDDSRNTRRVLELHAEIADSGSWTNEEKAEMLPLLRTQIDELPAALDSRFVKDARHVIALADKFIADYPEFRDEMTTGYESLQEEIDIDNDERQEHIDEMKRKLTLFRAKCSNPKASVKALHDLAYNVLHQHCEVADVAPWDVKEIEDMRSCLSAVKNYLPMAVNMIFLPKRAILDICSKVERFDLDFPTFGEVIKQSHEFETLLNEIENMKKTPNCIVDDYGDYLELKELAEKHPSHHWLQVVHEITEIEGQPLAEAKRQHERENPPPAKRHCHAMSPF